MAREISIYLGHTSRHGSRWKTCWRQAKLEPLGCAITVSDIWTSCFRTPEWFLLSIRLRTTHTSLRTTSSNTASRKEFMLPHIHHWVVLAPLWPKIYAFRL